MLKTRIILLALCIVLVTGLYLLPKVVVENDNVLSSPNDSTAAPIPSHAAAPREVQEAIQLVRALYLADSGKEKNAIFADSLANLYRIAGKFDSAAWFSGEASKFFNTTESRIKAGDLYYEAYTFAVDQEKQNLMATQAQAYYNEVLDENPNNLNVKTKLAMTYLTSPNPMQGITLLREVLKDDPKNELALFNMGMLSVQSGQNERAVERLEELIKINPNHTQGQLLLGIAYMNLGKKKDAKQRFEKVKQLDSDPAVQATVDSYLKDLK